MDVEVPCCMWGTTERDVNFDARVTNSKPPTCREPTGRRLHLRFRGRMFCAFLYHLNPFHLSKVLCHGNCRNMSEFTPGYVFGYLHQSVRGDPFWRFQWRMLPPARFKSVGCLALDFKPSRCCKTLQLCWDIRRISDFEVRVEINALHIPSSVLTFMCLDSLQHKSWWLGDAAGHQSGIHNAGTSKAAAQRRRRRRTRRKCSRLELACAYVWMVVSGISFQSWDVGKSWEIWT